MVDVKVGRGVVVRLECVVRLEPVGIRIHFLLLLTALLLLLATQTNYPYCSCPAWLGVIMISV